MQRTMTPEDYDAWYDTPRGHWIGAREWTMVRDALRLEPGERLLDVGCGTGWFTRRAETVTSRVVGLDIDAAALEFARRRSVHPGHYLRGDATALPFPDASFDKVMSIAALCFVADWPRAIAEIVRVTRQRFAIGLLNRHSLLYLRKGRHGGAGAYAGAHWHTRGEAIAALRGLPVARSVVSTGVFIDSASAIARAVERVMPPSLGLGSFLLLSGEPAPLTDSAR